MSRHPGNPYWCDEHDNPVAIMNQDDWDAAQASGHLTVEHVLLRLQDMLEYQFGSGAEMGLDENGFIVALVADGWRLDGGVTVHIFPNDHPPPHVHVRFRSDPKRQLRLAIESGEVLGADIPRGWAKKVRKVSAFVVTSQDLLMNRWVELHGEAI
jgi:hypothetical protein